jgi:hypothetical protein
MFDTLKYVKKLEAVGFSPAQAEASTRVLLEVMENQFLLRHEFETKILNNFDRLEKQIAALESRVDEKLDSLEGKIVKNFDEKLDLRLNAMKSEVIVKVGAMMAGAIILMTALQKLL